MAADVTKIEEGKNVIDLSIQEFNTIHILHNNVGGGSGSGNAAEATAEKWSDSVLVSSMSMINMCRYSIPHMSSNSGGSIINVSLVSAMRSKFGRSSTPYTMNKTAVVDLTRVMALDHLQENIRVNCIMPGLIWPSRVSYRPPESTGIRHSSTPLPYKGECWDFGWAAV